MTKDPTFVKMRNKRKKKDADDVEIVEVVDENAPKGTSMIGGQEFKAITYDKAAANLSQGIMVKLALSTEIYEDRFTFSAGKIISKPRSPV